MVFYVFVSFMCCDEWLVEVGLKYFVFGVLVLGILFYGVVLVYGFIGMMNYVGIVCVFDSGLMIG